ncbi:hypothetical protein LINPERPRIM_LOCUS33367 [Linum perenne]
MSDSSTSTSSSAVELQQQVLSNKVTYNIRAAMKLKVKPGPFHLTYWLHVEEFGEEPDLVTIFNYVYAQDGVVKDPAGMNVHMIEEEVILKTSEAMVIVSILLWSVAMN